VEAILEGIAEFLPRDVSPLSRYELDSYWGEILWENLSEEYADDELQAAFDARADEGYPCNNCGEEIS
jgi:hypothetical protein